MKRRALYLACGIPVAILVFLFLTLLFIPKDAIRGVLVRSAESAGYTLTFSGFAKQFPSGFKAQSLEVASAKGALIKMEEVRVRVRLLPLCTGKLRLAFNGRVGGGSLEGEMAPGKNQGWRVQGRSIKLEEIPFFSTVADARVKGVARIDGQFSDNKGVSAGDLQLEVLGAELARAKIGEMPLPDASYRQVRGALRIEKGRALLKSFTLEGDGIYVRLKGDTILAQPLPDSPLNLTLEMMPKPEFLERQKFVFLLLLKYQTSPGAYSIPVRGTLAHPAI